MDNSKQSVTKKKTSVSPIVPSSALLSSDAMRCPTVPQIVKQKQLVNVKSAEFETPSKRITFNEENCVVADEIDAVVSR